MEKDVLQKVLKNHELWMEYEGGKRADLAGADLADADLSNAYLADADLSGADLRAADLSYVDLNRANLAGADLSDADLAGADLSDADLSGADLRHADLSDADLTGANLSGADLRAADLTGAYLCGVVYDEFTAFFALQCPEEGSFVGWKKCQHDVLVKLLIPSDAKRSSATSRKCRASKALVLEVVGAEKAISRYDGSFVYEVGKEVVADGFDDDRWNECSAGIHFFMTRREAEND